MLIRNAEVWGHGLADVAIKDGKIAEIDPPAKLRDSPSITAIDAHGGALLPGLHDHHIHLAGLAVRASSVWCGPPDVDGPGALAEVLRSRPAAGWLRGIGYHESVMGLPDARELDRVVPDRPLRLQHRSGRMWLLNSCAIETLLARAEPPPGLERDAAGFTGRLFDEDQWLRSALGSSPPGFGAISAQLASFGVTGITDMSPQNGSAMAAHFTAQIRDGLLLQRAWLAGSEALMEAPPGPWHLGPAKLHLHETALPDFNEASNFIVRAHRLGRAAAIHCVSEVELVFALAALEHAGTQAGDRIEHASVASDELITRIASLGLKVCVQPQFVAERGDQYLSDVEARHHGELYRLRAFAEAGISMAGGSDAPFISAEPWAGMHSAVFRRTGSGTPFGENEALSPEAALGLYLADPADLTRCRQIAVGAAADLVLLDRPWPEARTRLTSDDVRLTLCAGRIIHDRVDQSPG
jgi:predicted amidohydrolase YtcJ